MKEKGYVIIDSGIKDDPLPKEILRAMKRDKKQPAKKPAKKKTPKK